MSKRRGSNTFLRVGLPLLLFVVGGSFGLKQFSEGKYEKRDHLFKSQSERAFNLDEEYKRMTKKLQLEDFELKPVPRLDDEPSTRQRR